MLLPEREERMKLTSANSACPQHSYYGSLLKPPISAVMNLALVQEERVLIGEFTNKNYCLADCVVLIFTSLF